MCLLLAGGGELVCGCGNNRVMMYDIERKRVVASALAHQDDINSVCYIDMAYQPHLVLSGSDDTLLKVRGGRTGVMRCV